MWSRQMRKIYVNVNMLLRQFSKCSTPEKCYLFNKYCSNVYCAKSWIYSNYYETIAYNNSIRRLFACINIIMLVKYYVCLNIMSFGEQLYSFCLRISSSLNSVIDNILYPLFLYIKMYGLCGISF